MVLKLLFRIYTKTFGGKIWTNLHRVSPGNFLGKKFNEASFKNFRQTIIQQHLVQKELKSNRQFLFCSSKKVSKQSEMFRFFERKFRLDMFIFTPFFRLQFFARDDIWKLLTKKHHGKLQSF